jgi:hypothetical protein
MYRPRRVRRRRATTPFLSDAAARGRRCLCARGAQATRHPTVSDRWPKQPSTAAVSVSVNELAIWHHVRFAKKLQLKNTLLIRCQCAGIRVRAGGPVVAPSSDCTLRDSAAMPSTNSQRIDTSESDPSSSSTACQWSDPDSDVSESQAACATL